MVNDKWEYDLSVLFYLMGKRPSRLILHHKSPPYLRTISTSKNRRQHSIQDKVIAEGKKDLNVVESIKDKNDDFKQNETEGLKLHAMKKY